MNINLIDNTNSYKVKFKLIDNNIISIETTTNSVFVKQTNIVDNFNIITSKVNINHSKPSPVVIK